MSQKREGRIRILQPVETPDGKSYPGSRGGFVTMLRPGAWYFYAGRLYVGYAWLSGFHQGEEPAWDPQPIPEGAIIETCNGEFHFKKVLSEGPPYYRKYAVLSFKYRYHPGDNLSGYFSKKINQGFVPVEEQYVLHSGCYMELQWGAGPINFPLIHPRDHKEVPKHWKEEDVWQKRRKAHFVKNGYDAPEYPEKYPKASYQQFYSFTHGNMCLTHKWEGDGRLFGRSLERKIKRSPSLYLMRAGTEVAKLRQEFHPKGCMRCFESMRK